MGIEFQRRPGLGKRFVPYFTRGYAFTFDLSADHTTDTATLRMKGDGSPVVEYPATFETGGYVAKLTPESTATLPAGTYLWELEDENGVLIGSGMVAVRRSLKEDGEQAVSDAVPFERKLLDEVERVLMDASQSADVSLTVEGRSFDFETRMELMRFRETLRGKLGMRPGSAKIGY